MIRITKDQLRELQDCRGSVDLDSGQVFEGVVGTRHNDGFWHLTVIWSEPIDEVTYDSFSFFGVTGEINGDA